VKHFVFSILIALARPWRLAAVLRKSRAGAPARRWPPLVGVHTVAGLLVLPAVLAALALTWELGHDPLAPSFGEIDSIPRELRVAGPPEPNPVVVEIVKRAPDHLHSWLLWGLVAGLLASAAFGGMLWLTAHATSKTRPCPVDVWRLGSHATVILPVGAFAWVTDAWVVVSSMLGGNVSVLLFLSAALSTGWFIGHCATVAWGAVRLQHDSSDQAANAAAMLFAVGCCLVVVASVILVVVTTPVA